jgi:hypothetical protein
MDASYTNASLMPYSVEIILKNLKTFVNLDLDNRAD